MAQLIDQLILQANNGDGQACFDLYQEFRDGVHVAENSKTAQEWLDKAIDFNHPVAKLIMEMDLLVHGYVQEAMDALQAQCQEGNTSAMVLLGQVYLGNVINVCDDILDVDRGLDLLHQAAFEGNVEAQILLGKSYYTGKWTAPDKFMARFWLEKASASGNEEAGMLYDEALREVTGLN